MSDPKTIEMFDTLAKVLLRCGVLGYLLLLLSVGVILIAGDPIYRLNGSLFGLSKHELADHLRMHRADESHRALVLLDSLAGHSTRFA